jgi:hypothetical protein
VSTINLNKEDTLVSLNCSVKQMQPQQPHARRNNANAHMHDENQINAQNRYNGNRKAEQHFGMMTPKNKN